MATAILHLTTGVVYARGAIGTFSATSFTPATNDGGALGSTSLQFSDLFLAEGGVINWDNGDITLTQTGDVLALAGGDLAVGATPATSGVIRIPNNNSVKSMNAAGNGAIILFRADGSDIATFADNGFSTRINGTVVQVTPNIVPTTTDTASLGTASVQWSDLFLAEGGVINWDNGDATLTQASNMVTLAGADLTAPVINATGLVVGLSATATTAGGLQAIRVGTTAALGIYFGSGAPTITAGQGSIYIRSDGSSVATRLYVNTDAGTTWTNVVTAA